MSELKVTGDEEWEYMFVYGDAEKGNDNGRDNFFDC